ncbi:MAG: hypothetical protein QM278_06210 [Pseudomonadota bacterium]|nr:hypothetical protein [Pseudomonadota bacterium]
MTKELIQTLAAQPMNNLRALNHMAADILAVAAERNLTKLDESLFFELFASTPTKTRRTKTSQP